MFLNAKVVVSKNLSKRGYITFYIDGKRYREYTGNKINIDINPNSCRTYSGRLKQLNELAFEFSKALENGWHPDLSVEPEQMDYLTFQQALKDILIDKENQKLSKLYTRDLQDMYRKLVKHFPKNILQQDITKIENIDIEPFMNQFRSSGTYYMSERKVVNVYFAELLRKKLIKENPVQLTKPMKRAATLHQIYSQDQLKTILEFLKNYHPNLHLTCLMTYGCFLRPHQEIRLLKRGHFANDFTKIILSGEENKSRRVRTSLVPNYIREILLERLGNISDPETNLLSVTSIVYNDSYINTQWSRAKKKMLEMGIIEKNQTIYSFRHTGAVNVYRKTKDLHILQQLLQHSNMIVTLNYLRGLGEIDEEGLKNNLPEL